MFNFCIVSQKAIIERRLTATSNALRFKLPSADLLKSASKNRAKAGEASHPAIVAFIAASALLSLARTQARLLFVF